MYSSKRGRCLHRVEALHAKVDINVLKVLSNEQELGLHLADVPTLFLIL